MDGDGESALNLLGMAGVREGVSPAPSGIPVAERAGGRKRRSGGQDIRTYCMGGRRRWLFGFVSLCSGGAREPVRLRGPPLAPRPVTGSLADGEQPGRVLEGSMTMVHRIIDSSWPLHGEYRRRWVVISCICMTRFRSEKGKVGNFCLSNLYSFRVGSCRKYDPRQRIHVKSLYFYTYVRTYFVGLFARDTGTSNEWHYTLAGN